MIVFKWSFKCSFVYILHTIHTSNTFEGKILFIIFFLQWSLANPFKLKIIIIKTIFLNFKSNSNPYLNKYLYTQLHKITYHIQITFQTFYIPYIWSLPYLEYNYIRLLLFILCIRKFQMYISIPKYWNWKYENLVCVQCCCCCQFNRFFYVRISNESKTEFE